MAKKIVTDLNVKGQKVLMNIPVKCENNWIMRRKKGN